MKALKLLYIDTPFIGFDSGDKNRSKFLYKTLLQKYDTDILLIQEKEYDLNTIISHRADNRVFTFKSKKQKWYKSSAILDFEKKELEKLKTLLLKNSYDICFLRMASMGVLAEFIKKELPKTKIVVDVDMIFSQISKAAWTLNKSVKNRYHFFEYHKLTAFEKKFFNKDYTFLYTNKNELSLVKQKYNLLSDDNHFVLPNVINKIPTKKQDKIDDKFILFYGVLNSTANLSAYEYLIQRVYPLIKFFLISNDIKIYIVGKNPTKAHKNTPQNVELIGEVDDIAAYIKQSMLVLFPLTVASGTLTRILEVASMKKSIVATKIAANGLDLEGKIFIANNEMEIAEDILTIYEAGDSKQRHERLAYDFVQENYSFKSVQTIMYSILDEISSKTSVVHIPRRFTKSHWGGTENVVMSLANGLKDFNIKSKVVTTNILCDKKEEIINSIKVKRFNYFYPYFNLSNQSKQSLDLVGGNLFSWSMFYYLFFLKDVDLIHLHTAKRMGAIARTICKLRDIPYVITVHGGLYDISDNEKQNRMQPTQNSFEWGKVLGFLFGSRKVYDDANSIITLNKNEYENTKKNYPNKDVYLLTNSVNIKSFQIKKDKTFRSRHNINEDSFVFLSTARIDKQKNQLLTIKAFEKLFLKQENIHLLLVGNITDEEYFDEIKNYIQTHSLESNITLLTNLKPKSSDLVNSYLNSNAFVLASRHEPFGIVALEAWASKLPLIISDICGICNNIKENKTALVFQDNNENELLEHMQNLIYNKRLKNTLISNASKEVLNYDESEVNKTLSKIYEKTINSKKNK